MNQSRLAFFIAGAFLILEACLPNTLKVDVALAAPPVAPPGTPRNELEVHKHSEPSPDGVKPAVAGPLLLRAALSHPWYTHSTPGKLLLKIDLEATSAAQSRPPLNLALVIDRSGSMRENNKFTQAMEAAKLVVENLTDRDLVTIIAFSDQAVVLSPAGRAVNKPFLYHRLTEIAPEGWTNLSAGLLEALAQIDSHSTQEQAKRVIVLTDGLANRGITDPGQLRKLVAAARTRSIAVSTLGVGTEFDEKLLVALVEAGGGRYTYARSSEQIPTAMAAELDGLLAVVAQNVKMTIQCGEGAEITRVYGRLLDRPTRSYSFDLGDMRAAERGVFLLELTPRTFAAGATLVAGVSLSLDEPQAASRQTESLSLKASFTEELDRVRDSEEGAIVRYAAVRSAVEEAEEAAAGLDDQRYRRLRERFEHVYDETRQAALDRRDQELLNQTFMLKHFMSELAAASESGLLHEHTAAQRRLAKEIDYRQYLLEHHRPTP